MKNKFILLSALCLWVLSLSAEVTYVLPEGAVTNPYGWTSKQDMYNALNAAWNKYSGSISSWTPLSEITGNNDNERVVKGIPTEAAAMTTAFFEDAAVSAQFGWLLDYMDALTAEQDASLTLPSSSSSALRYSLSAFFLSTQRTTYPKTANFKNETGYFDYWKMGFANPTTVESGSVVLQAPYLEGKTFRGWFTDALGLGKQITTISASSNYTLYACFGKAPLKVGFNTYYKTAYIDRYVEDGLTDSVLIIPEVLLYDGIECKVTSISSYAFNGCGVLKQVVLPNSITSIGYGAFQMCIHLEQINIPEGITQISSTTFKYCERLRSITIPDNVTVVNSEAFRGCYNLEEVKLSNNLTTIGDEAFYNCGIKEITLPRSLINLSETALSSCSSLANIYVAEDNILYASYDGNLYDSDLASLIFVPEGKKGEINLPASLVNINDLSQLKYNWNITAINVDAANIVYSSLDGILYDKDKEALLFIPSSYYKDTLHLPSTIRDIDAIQINEQFFKYFSIEGSKRYISLDGVLYSNDTTELVCFPRWYYQSYYTIPEQVLTIGKGAMVDAGLQELYIPSNITSVGDSAFYSRYNRDISIMMFQSSMPQVGKNAFDGVSRIYVQVDLVTTYQSLAKNATVSPLLTSKINELNTIDYGKTAIIDADYYLSYQGTILFVGDETGMASIAFTNNALSLPQEGTHILAAIKTYSDYFEIKSILSVKEISSPLIPQDTIKPYEPNTDYNLQYIVMDSVNIDEYVNISIPYCYDKRSYNVNGTEYYSYTEIYNVSEEEYPKNSILRLTGVMYITDSRPNGRFFVQTGGIEVLKDVTELFGYKYNELHKIATITSCAAKFITDSTVTIPEYTTYEGKEYKVTGIGAGAFRDIKKLKYLNIPSSINTIEYDRPFYGCTNLSYINVDTNNQYYASDNGVLMNKNTIPARLICVPAKMTGRYEVPNGITTIVDDAFAYSQLSEVILPESLTEIGSFAFINMPNLKSLTIPKNVTDVRSYIVGADCETVYWNAERCNIVINSALYYVKNIVLGDGVTLLPDRFCASSYNLTEITLNTQLRYIGEEAFNYCPNLKSVICNAKVAPKTSGEIFTRVADGCTLTILDCADKASYSDSENWGKLAINTTEGECEDLLPVDPLVYSYNEDEMTATVTKCYNHLIADDGKVIIPNTVEYQGKEYNVTTINSQAFKECTNLVSVTLPQGVSFLSSQVFYKCPNLVSINVDESNPNLTSIDGIVYSINNNRDIELIRYVPEGIGDTVIIPEGVTEIGGFNSFSGYPNIKYVEFPSTTRTINEFLFVPNLETLFIRTSFVPEVNNHNIELPSNVKVYITPCTSVEDYKAYPVFEDKEIIVKEDEKCTWRGYLADLSKVKDGADMLTIGVITYIDGKTIYLSDEGNGAFAFVNEELDNSYINRVAYIGGVKSTLNGYHAINEAYIDFDDYSWTLPTFDATITDITSGKYLASLVKILNVNMATDNALNIYNDTDTVQCIIDEAFSSCQPISGNVDITGVVILKDNKPALVLTSVTKAKSLLEYTIVNDSTVFVTGFNSDVLTSNTITIPEQVTIDSKKYTVGGIGEQVFANNTKIENVVLPPSVITIGNNCFYYCTNLKSINTENVILFGSSAFFGCSSLTEISLSSAMYIRQLAFVYTAIETLNWSVTGVWDETAAFGDNMSPHAFDGILYLKNIILAEDNPYFVFEDGVLYTKDKSAMMFITAQVESVSLPASVTAIGVNAFIFANNLQEITINSTSDIPCELNEYTKLNISIVVYVPGNAFYAYKSHSIWGNCDIRAIEGTEIPSYTLYYYDTSDSKFVVWYWLDDRSGQWTEWMTPVEGHEGWYEVKVPIGFENVIFAAMPSDSSDPAWNNKVYQTDDLRHDSKNIYYVPGWGWQNSFDIPDTEAEEITTDEPAIEPQAEATENSVVVTWPAIDNAVIYTIVIKKGEEIICELEFNSIGQLISIAFGSPDRSGRSPQAAESLQATGGWQYTIRGLNAGTEYSYSVFVTKDDTVIYENTIPFRTKGTPTALDSVNSNDTTVRKEIHNGILYIILPDGQRYSIIGTK